MSRTVLHISDCHLVVSGTELIGVDTQASLAAVLDQALGEQVPDAIIASGDLAHDPSLPVYARFLQTVRQRFAGPLLCLPGNHDVLGVMTAAGLPMAPVDIAPWTLVPLDSHEDELPRALVTEADRSALLKAVARSTQPHLLLATHHPLVMVGCPWLDCDRIGEPDQLITWIQEHSPISNGQTRLRACVFGHVHQAVEGHCAQVPVYGVPSTCFQFQPHSQKFALDKQAPGYRWLTLGDNGEVHTRLWRVASFKINPDLSGVTA